MPTNIKRYFRSGGGRQIFPVGEGNSEYHQDNGQPKDISSAIDASYWKGNSNGFGGQARQLIQIGTIGKDSEATRVYSPDGCARTLKDGGGMGAKTELYGVTPLRWSRTEKGKEARRKSQQEGKDYTPFNKGHRELVEAEEPIAGCVTNALNKDALIGVAWSKSTRDWGVEEKIKEGEANTLNCGEGCGNQSTKNYVVEMKTANAVTPDAYLARGERSMDENMKVCPTIPSQHSGPHGQDGWFHSIKQERRIRRLTPTECARLQGFPDDWCEGLSDTQAYKCYGNAVTTLVVKAVGERILKGEK